MDFNGKLANENIVIKEIKKQSVQFQNFKFPIRVGSKKHQFKRQSWVLPEGQTVLEKTPQIESKRKLHICEPNIILYFDIFLALKQLLKDSLHYLEKQKELCEDKSEKEAYGLLQRRIVVKKKKVNDLLELYIHQQHMKTGATTLLSSLQQRKTSGNSSVSPKQISECSLQRNKNLERLIAIQTELNEMSGTFKFQILGLVGFSRLVPGDVFEISFKHVEQKTKSKCKIVALGQNWTNSIFQFKGNLAEDLFIKIAEKGTVIGSVVCAMQEFACSKAQVYVIPLNTNGTIKLKIGAIWSPMDTSDRKYVGKENFKYSFPSSDFSTAPVVNIITASQKKRDGGNIGSSNILQYNIPRSPVSPLVIKSQSPINSPRTPSKSPINKLNLTNSPKSSFAETPSPLSKHYPKNESPKYKTDLLNNRKSRSFDSYDGNHSSVSSIPPSPLSNSFNSSSQSSPFTPSLFNSFNVSSFDSPNQSNVMNTSSELIFDFNVPSNKQKYNQKKTNYRKISHDETLATKDYNDIMMPRSHSDSSHIKIEVNNSTHVANVAVSNDVRVTKVPVAVSAQYKTKENFSPKHFNNTNGHIQRDDKKKKTPPPPVKPKPKTKSSSSPQLDDDVHWNDDNAITKLLELCEDILSKLNYREAIQKNVQALYPKIQEIFDFFSAKTQLKRTPSLTESISSALDSFNFLNNKDDDGITIRSGLSSPTQESITSTLNLPSNWRKCDRVLIHHLKLLKFLISDFSAANGPLVLREMYYLKSISKQLSFISDIFKTINLFEDITASGVCHKCSGSGTLANVWEVSATNLQPMYCTADDLYAAFAALFQYTQWDYNMQQDEIKKKVCQIAVDEVNEKSLYGEKHDIISVYQFVDLFKNRLRTHNVIGYLKDLQQELFCFSSLISKNDMIVMTMLQQPRLIPIVQPCVYQLLAMTANTKSATKTAVFNTLIRMKDISEENNSKLTELLLQCIEERNAILRAAACLALGKLKVQSASTQLMYINKYDGTPLVQDAASKALTELGYSFHSSHA